MAYFGKTDERALYHGAFPDTFRLSRQLRRDLTPVEKILWNALRNRSVGGCKFRRQHPVREYIVDFYCHEKELVIEVDGGIHQDVEVSERDKNRTAELERMGLRVLRFSNDEVLYALDHVIKEIEKALLSPSPGGEGAGG
jgi:very-short-patch-repair endonuclease